MKHTPIKVFKGACSYCKGDVMGNYKHRPWLGKCIGCKRVWTIQRMEVDNC